MHTELEELTTMLGSGFSGVYSAPSGMTALVASIRLCGHTFHDRRIPSFSSNSANASAIFLEREADRHRTPGWAWQSCFNNRLVRRGLEPDVELKMQQDDLYNPANKKWLVWCGLEAQAVLKRS